MNSLSALGSFPKDTFGNISRTSYENIFRVYNTEVSNQKPLSYYNILTSIYLPDELIQGTYYSIRINRIMPWTAISYNEYRTMNLWWLIVAANKIINPTKFPAPGTTLKIIKRELITTILNGINQQLLQ